MPLDDSPLDLIRREALAALRPPLKRPLGEWIEENVHLPSSIAATPGRMRLWPHQRAIADSMGDPAVERVSVLKSARVGYSQLLAGVAAHYAVNDPAPQLAVLPADADCRHFMAGLIEPTFAESPTLRAALLADATGRDTMLGRFYPGGSLTLVPASAPRGLRARTARVLILDEVDGFEVDARGEGDPVALAEKRTLSYGNRKIIMGSTPVDEATSRIVRAYEASDRRIYEVGCPHCGDFAEVAWRDIHWQPDRPETAEWGCPSCGCLTPEAGKAELVRGGRWRATRPEVTGHHGYRVNALVSLLPNASWGRLAAEWLEAKRSPVTLKVFVNTILAEPWRGEGDDVDPADLARRQRPHDLARIPADVLALTVGGDVQGDRVELSTVGWTRDGGIRLLAHEVAWGSPLEDATWAEVDVLLRRQWAHPLGGMIGVAAALIDSGAYADSVYGFCRPRAGRRVFASKGVAGFGRPALAWGSSRKARLALVGVDALKAQVHQRLAHGDTLTLSDQLGPDHLDQLAAERLVVRYSRGHPVRSWVKVPGRRNEGLDCLAYALAARQLVGATLDGREAELTAAPKPRATVARSKFLSAA